MNVFIFLVLAIGALARPDVSHLGYQYGAPATSYEVPSGSVGNLHVSSVQSTGGAANRQYYHVDGPKIPIGSLAPSTAFQTPVFEPSSFTSPGRGSFGTTGTSSFTGSQQTYTQGSRPSSFNVVNTGGSLASKSSFAGQQVQQGEVSKHLYFFTAPDEPQQIQPRVNFAAGPPKKNVKILFIKTPSFGAGGRIQIPALPQSEDKTIVYVLVNKQDQETEINVEAPQPAKPSKPEVYFIKYKSQEEANDAVSKVQSGVVPSGVLTSANSVEGDQAFISSIGRDITLNQQRQGELSPSINNFDLRGSFGVRHEGEGASSASVSSEEISGGTSHLPVSPFPRQQGGDLTIGGPATGAHATGGIGGYVTGGTAEATQSRGSFTGSSTVAPHTVYGPPN